MNVAGKVTLIGAGPGDGGLLTNRAVKALATAEVVLADRLVGADVLAMIPTGAQVVDVGKESGNHKVPQEEINRLIFEFARAGKHVIRLKGGDPYLFGRGAEELEQVIKAGIPFEVIPGISASLAVPSWAGIPVTHRELGSSVHILTGHAKTGGSLALDYQSLVNLGGTLIFMMGVASLGQILKGLATAGMRKDMPAALIHRGTLPQQRKVIGTISTLESLAEQAKITAPAVLVVGQVCSLSDQLDWASQRPLAGKTALITRPLSAGSSLGDSLESLGCHVIPFPCIHLQQREHVLPEDLSAYAWVCFTSAFGVQVFFEQLLKSGQDSRSLAHLKFAVIGSRTGAELQKRGIRADYMPEVYDAAHLGKGLVKNAGKAERILLFRAAGGTPDLVKNLQEEERSFDDIVAYDTLYQNPAVSKVSLMLADGFIDYITFTSVSAVEGFVRTVGRELAASSTYTGVCIGQQTQAAAKAYGIRTVVSEQATVESMVEKIQSLEEEER